MTGDAELASDLGADWRKAPIGERLRAILGYAEKLTRTPAGVRAQDIEDLRAAGLEDRAILDAAQVTAYFNFVNRLADGLGVEME